MTALVANFVGMTVSGTPGTGPITLGSTIAPGSISFATAYGQDTTVDLTYVDGVNRACETGCIYNHASNTITRGYNETSTTGSVLSLTPNALIFVSWPASKVNAFNQMFVNVGTNEIPIWELEANIIPRTDTLANLSVLTSGGGELCSATDDDAIVQLQGTPGSGTVKYYSPMYPGTYAPAGQGSSTVFIPNHPWINTDNTHNFTIGSTYSSNTVKGGRLTVRGGNNTSTGSGGDVYLSGGTAGSSGTASNGGTVNITTSNGYGTGKAGNILIQAGSNSTPVNGEGYVRIRANGSTLIEAGPVYSTLGFYSADPITKPQVTGSRTDGTSLLSLLSALDSLGLINNTSSAQYSLAAVIPELLTFGQPELLPIPQRTAAYKITSVTYYVDPTWGGPYNGTFTQPYNSPTQATLAAGDGLLFKAGTTTTITAAIIPAVTGTSNAPIVYGVYDGNSGNRISGLTGLAIIDCNNSAINGFYAGNLSYICVDGLKFQNNSGANDLIKLYGNNTHCQVLSCETADGGTAGHIVVHTTGSNHIIEGCKCVGIGTESSLITLQIAVNDSTSKIQFNSLISTGNFGISIYDGYQGYSFSGHVSCNTIENSSIIYFGGISFTVAGGAFKCYRNTISKVPKGILVVSSLYGSTVGADFSNSIIQNNDISNCEFNITIAAAYGTWVVEYNRLLNAGSYEGTASITSNAYGRNIELNGGGEYSVYNPSTTYAAENKIRFGPDLIVYESLQNANTGNKPDSLSSTWWVRRGPAANVRDGTIRFNYCSGAYNWHNVVTVQGSEGVGIGIDNNTQNVSVYGNYCVSNEGNGIQLNSGRNNYVYGNLCIDNFHFRAGRTTTPREMDSAQIVYVLNPGSMIFNNTCISLGETHQKYSISEAYSGNPSKNGKVFNNLSIGASVAGIRLDNTGVSALEDHNIVVGSAAVVLDIDGAATTAGTGTTSAASVGTLADWYRPIVGSACDGTGAAVPGWAVSLDGKPISLNPPIGALYPE